MLSRYIFGVCGVCGVFGVCGVCGVCGIRWSTNGGKVTWYDVAAPLGWRQQNKQQTITHSSSTARVTIWKNTTAKSRA